MNKNNFSYWFPKIEGCGIRVPKSQVFKVPEEVQQCFYLDRKDDRVKIAKWVHTNVVPFMSGEHFMKNAVFSNKFDFKSCLTNARTIAEDITNINYQALCLDAGGLEEIVLREVIRYNHSEVPTIYNGLPLRSEFRVFYDFDARKVLYSVNYWDYDYVVPHLHTKTDKIVFEYMKERLATVFQHKKLEVEELVAKHMQDVDLQGKWSIDILYKPTVQFTTSKYPMKFEEYVQVIDAPQQQEEYWLIDMAEAHRSAYWKDKTNWT